MKYLSLHAHLLTVIVPDLWHYFHSFFLGLTFFVLALTLLTELLKRFHFFLDIPMILLTFLRRASRYLSDLS